MTDGGRTARRWSSVWIVALTMLGAGTALAQQPTVLVPDGPARPANGAPAIGSVQPQAPLQQLPPTLPTAVTDAGVVTAPVDSDTTTTLADSTPRCMPEIAAAEARYDIPRGLLISIALAESGRIDPESGTMQPWPWSINVLGDGRFYATEIEAEGAVTKKLGQGVALVDVGCMQVNLYNHPNAFQTLKDAFDPAHNVEYAAHFLADLYKRQRSWPQAAAAYHSGDPGIGGRYVARVLYYWKTLGITPPPEFADVAAVARTKSASFATASAGKDFKGFTVEVTPDTMDIAADFYGKRDYQSSSLIYRAVLSSRPDDKTALLGLGETLQGGGYPGEARTYLERLVALVPQDKGAMAALLADIALLPAGEQKAALMSAQQMAPGAPEIPSQLAIFEQAAGNLPGAVAAAGRAAALAPRDAVAALNYASLLDHYGDRTSAVRAYNTFLSLYNPGLVPASITPAAIRGRIQYLQSNP